MLPVPQIVGRPVSAFFKEVQVPLQCIAAFVSRQLIALRFGCDVLVTVRSCEQIQPLRNDVLFAGSEARVRIGVYARRTQTAKRPRNNFAVGGAPRLQRIVACDPIRKVLCAILQPLFDSLAIDWIILIRSDGEHH